MFILPCPKAEVCLRTNVRSQMVSWNACHAVQNEQQSRWSPEGHKKVKEVKGHSGPRTEFSNHGLFRCFRLQPFSHPIALNAIQVICRHRIEKGYRGEKDNWLEECDIWKLQGQSGKSRNMGVSVHVDVHPSNFIWGDYQRTFIQILTGTNERDFL